MLPFLLMRLMEPSSYGGLAIAGQAVNAMAHSGFTYAGFAQAVGGFMAFILPENTPATSGGLTAASTATAPPANPQPLPSTPGQ